MPIPGQQNPKLRPPIDWDLPVETVGDESTPSIPVIIFTTNALGNRKVIGQFVGKEYNRNPQVWDLNGVWYAYTTGDSAVVPRLNLRNVETEPKESVAWLNIYPNPDDYIGEMIISGVHRTKEEADRDAGMGRVGRNKVVIRAEFDE